MDANEYVTLGEYNENDIKVNCVQGVADKMISVGLAISIVDADNNKIDGSGTIWLTNPMTGCTITTNSIKYSFYFE